MANAIFRGGAGAVAQVDKATPAAVESGDTFTMTITDHLGAVGSVTHANADEDEAATVTGLYDLAVAAKAAGEVPWTRITATDDTSYVSLTADTAGMPFALVCSKTGTGTLTRAAVTAVSGPNLLSVADNYQGGAIPVGDTDALIIPADCAYSIYYEDLSAIALTALDIEKGYSGDIACAALPLLFDLTGAGTIANLAGTGNIHLGLQGSGAVINIREAGVGSGAGTYGMNLSVGEAVQVINIMLDSPGGRVGLAAIPGQVAEFATIKVTQGEVKIGSGVTVTDIITSGGITHCEATPTGDIINTGGQFYREGCCAAVNWFVYAPAKAYERSGGNVSGTIAVAGVIDASQDLRSRTWAVTVVHKGGKIIDPGKTIIFTANLELHRCGLEAVDRGDHMDVVFSAVS